MTPTQINTAEESFSKTLKDSNGIKWTKIDTIDLGEGISITKIKQDSDTYFYKTSTTKKKVCLHFTVGSIKGDIATLGKKDNHVSVNYVVDRNGNIYQLFDEKYWSYHLGSNCIGSNGSMSKETIGIEISNFGPLKKKTDGYYDAYGNLYTKDEADVIETDLRGYNYFAKMTTKQETAVVLLLKYICDNNGIKKEIVPEVFTDSCFADSKRATEACGIMTHIQFRKDKFDWPNKCLENIFTKFKEITTEKPKVEVKLESKEEYSCKDPAFFPEESNKKDNTLTATNLILNDIITKFEASQDKTNTTIIKSKEQTFKPNLIDFLIGLFK